jgi:hypothetical protein
MRWRTLKLAGADEVPSLQGCDCAADCSRLAAAAAGKKRRAADLTDDLSRS